MNFFMNFAEEIFELITMSRVSHTHTHTPAKSFFLLRHRAYRRREEKRGKIHKSSASLFAKGKSTFCLYLSVQLLFTSRAVKSLSLLFLLSFGLLLFWKGTFFLQTVFFS
jgi:hypothetical protein